MPRSALLLSLFVFACKSAGAPPLVSGTEPPPASPPPPPPPATATGATCFTHAEETSESDPNRAEEELRHCLTFADAPPASYQLLATLLGDRGAHDEARQLLQLGVRRFPASVLLQVALARLSLQMGRHREGISALGVAHRLRPNDDDIQHEYQEALATHGTKEDRLDAELQPLLLEATGRYEIDDIPGAIHVLEMALKKTGGVPRLRATVHHRLAIIHLGSGHLADAKKHLEAAMAAEKMHTALRADVLVSYAEVLLSENKLAEAEKAAGEAIVIEPANPLAYANLAIARSLAGNSEGAMTAFEKAFDSGLARKLTMSDFLKIGKPIEALKAHPGFALLMKRAYPASDYRP